MSRDFDYLAKEKEKKKDKKNVEISTFNVNVKKTKTGRQNWAPFIFYLFPFFSRDYYFGLCSA